MTETAGLDPELVRRATARFARALPGRAAARGRRARAA